LIEGRAAHPVPTAHIRRRRPGLLLLQYRDDLLFAEPAPLHSVRLPRWAGLYSNLEETAGLRPPAKPLIESFIVDHLSGRVLLRIHACHGSKTSEQRSNVIPK